MSKDPQGALAEVRGRDVNWVREASKPERRTVQTTVKTWTSTLSDTRSYRRVMSRQQTLSVLWFRKITLGYVCGKMRQGSKSGEKGKGAKKTT